MTEPPRFDYTAVADGHDDERFTSNIEYVAEDQLPVSEELTLDHRWTVERVENTGNTFWAEDRSRQLESRVLYCTVA